MSQDIFKELNPKQKEAVSHIKGASVIVAGAGSGKTRVLVYKVINLIEHHHVNPQSIIMITFTNKAAQAMKERIRLKLGYIGTFHSFCAQILRRQGGNIGLDPDFTIYDENDQSQLLKSIVKTMNIEKYTPNYFLNRISAAKNQLIPPNRYLDIFSDYNAATVAAVYKTYQKKLKENQAVDFDDLIMLTVDLFVKHPQVLKSYQDKYRHILVDEFQDTNYAQYVFTRLLGEKYKNLTVVGDFSQSIYSWRGADIRNLEKFQEDFPEVKVFNLEENYRSTQNILDFAYQVISKNQTHPILKLYTQNIKGEAIDFFEADNEEYEAIYIAEKIKAFSRSEPYKSFAILYRTNAQSRIIEEAFLHYGIPYVLIGGTRFYERREIKDVLSYLRLLINPVDQVAKERIQKLGVKRWQEFKNLYQSAKETVPEKTTSELMEEIFNQTGYLKQYNPDDEEDYARLENIKELKSVAISFPKLTEFLEQVALVESEYFEGERRRGGKNEGVRLMTLHQAKGLEFPYVFIAGLEEGLLPHSRSLDDLFSLEEERRLFYVGITRAKKRLHITHAKKRFIFGRRGETVKSRFLGEEDASLL